VGEPLLGVGFGEGLFEGGQTVDGVGEEDDHGEFAGFVGDADGLERVAFEVAETGFEVHEGGFDGLR